MRPMTSKVNALLAVAAITLAACGSAASSPSASAVAVASAPAALASVPPSSLAVVTESPPSAAEVTNAPAVSPSAPAAVPSVTVSAGPSTNSGSAADVTAISAGLGAAGQEHACAVLATGGVKCWGDNTYGALGDGSASAPQNVPEASSATPVAVTGLDSGVTAIAVGQSAACAIAGGGGVMCWGANGDGELGNGSTADAANMTNIYSAVPVKVLGLTSGVTAIAHGQSFACALTAGGGVKCWGDNSIYGELGNGSATSGTRSFSPTPVDVKGLSSGVTAITAGLDFACALTTTGGVKCWGQGGDIFDIGNFANSTVPFAVTDRALQTGVKAISAGGAFLCVLTAADGVRCLGGDRFGQIGSGRIAPQPGVSADVSGLTRGVTTIAAGGQFACALTDGGGVKCWGDGYGFTCSSPTACQSVPVDVPNLAGGVSALAAGWSQACAITTANGVECWGASSGTGPAAPVVVPGL